VTESIADRLVRMPLWAAMDKHHIALVTDAVAAVLSA